MRQMQKLQRFYIFQNCFRNFCHFKWIDFLKLKILDFRFVAFQKKKKIVFFQTWFVTRRIREISNGKKIVKNKFPSPSYPSLCLWGVVCENRSSPTRKSVHEKPPKTKEKNVVNVVLRSETQREFFVSSVRTLVIS